MPEIGTDLGYRDYRIQRAADCRIIRVGKTRKNQRPTIQECSNPYVLQVLQVRQPPLLQWRSRCSFSWIRAPEQTYRAGFPEASVLPGLWLHGICNPACGVTTAREERHRLTVKAFHECN